MVNRKPKKVEKKSVLKARGSSKKTSSKKKDAVKKKETTVQKKKSPVKKTTTAKGKKPVAKKVTKKSAAKSKPKVSAVKKTTTAKGKKPVAVKKPVKKNLKKVATEKNADLKIKKASKTQIKKVESVIDKLSQKPKQHFVTTVPGVLRKVPATQKSVSVAHKELPITAILNFFKKGN